MEPQLCLGTVQLGVPYGITNNNNRIGANDIQKILITASTQGITTLDTAQSYGYSEEFIGRFWPTTTKCKIISKLPANISKQNKNSWPSIFQESLVRLKTNKLYGLLLHDPTDLLGLHGKKLISWLISLKERQLVEKIGVSIYTANELEWIPLDKFDIIQLPISIYDQRLLKNKTIEKLHDLGISIHARSIFLQGIILEQSSKWPRFLSSEFREHHTSLQRALKEDGLNLLDAAIGFTKSIAQLEYILVGVVNSEQLLEINASYKKFDVNKDYKFTKGNWAWPNEKEINPSKWTP